jgi:hypothetical protein
VFHATNLASLPRIISTLKPGRNKVAETYFDGRALCFLAEAGFFEGAFRFAGAISFAAGFAFERATGVVAGFFKAEPPVRCVGFGGFCAGPVAVAVRAVVAPVPGLAEGALPSARSDPSQNRISVRSSP